MTRVNEGFMLWLIKRKTKNWFLFVFIWMYILKFMILYKIKLFKNQHIIKKKSNSKVFVNVYKTFLI